MLASVLGTVADLVGILAGVVVVGGVGVAGGRRWKTWRARPLSEHATVAEVVTVLAGEKPSRLNKRPPPGIIARVGTLEKTAQATNTLLATLQASVTDLHHRLVPNGGNTTNPGDVLQRVERQQEAIMNHLGIPQAEQQ